MTNNPNKWFDPLYDLIEDRLKLLKHAPATKQGMDQQLLDDNHKAYIGKYLLICKEYLLKNFRTW